MSLNSLQVLLSGEYPASNISINDNQTFSDIPSTLLDSLVPGYGPIHKFFLYFFGFDITVVVTLGLVLWLLGKVSDYLWHAGRMIVTKNYMSSIVVSSQDDLFEQLLIWLSDHPKIRGSRSLMAETPSKGHPETDEVDSDNYDSESELDDENPRCVNFATRDARILPKFSPALGIHYLWHNGIYFMIIRQTHTIQRGGWYTTERESMTLSCFGRSTQPIKDMIQEARNLHYTRHQFQTVIRRPAPKDARRYGGGGCWTRIAQRPCRPMSTVVLDSKRKREVLTDMNEFLHPQTSKWYAERGIPYRRGYLFHGPPGTGKTSLSFALAGVFGLDIYVVSLLEPSLTEEDLEVLFTFLPRHCIVLLEDIDAAGLLRQEESSTKESGDEDKKKKKKTSISLSGLLNTIDGVASHEGRVLVLTTNKPETLDEALIRPGRVDLQVGFENASHHQIAELFFRMYTDSPSVELTPTFMTSGSHVSNKKSDALPPEYIVDTSIDRLTPPLTPTGKPSVDKIVELEASAESFASSIPSGEFSPAEIQGFLLKRKKSPGKAVAEVDAWVTSTLESRKAKSKVLGVQ